MARALTDLESAARVPEEGVGVSGAIDLRTTWFPDAQLGRIEDGAVIAWVRGARPGRNMHHGSPTGAGLLRVWSKQRGADVLDKGSLRGNCEGEWSAMSQSFAPLRGWRANQEELRFSLWLARVAWRAGRPWKALTTPFTIARRGLFDFATRRATSAWDLAPTVEVVADGLTLRGALAHRDGSRCEGAEIERSFTVDGTGLAVDERVRAEGLIRALGYSVPQAATGVVRTPFSSRYRLE